MKNLVIVGTGAFARELYHHTVQSRGYNLEFTLKGFIDGDVKSGAEECAKLPLPVLGDIFSYEIQADDVFTCGAGTPFVRRKLIEAVLSRGGKFISIVHYSAIVHPGARLGEGVILCPFTYVFDNALLGDFAMLNCHSGLGHDAVLGEFSCAMGHVDLCGFVQCGKDTFFGSGSRVLPHGKVGDGAFVGAGSVVLKKVKAGDKVFGVPAVSIKNLEG